MKFNKKAAIVFAILVGISLIFMSAKKNTSYTIDPIKLGESIISDEDRIKAAQLNDMIIQKHTDYLLLDIRSEKKYDEGFIPSAENMPIRTLLTKESISELPSDIPVILYSNGNSTAHQAWVVLKSAGLKVFVLEGGYHYWIQFPDKKFSSESDDEVLRYKKDLAAANSLKGISTSNPNATITSKPKPPKKKSRRKKKKKKLEGC